MTRASTADNHLVHAHTTRRLATDPTDALLFYRRDRPVQRQPQPVLWAAQPSAKPCTTQAKLPVAPVKRRGHIVGWIVVFVIAAGVGVGAAVRDVDLFAAYPTAPTVPMPPLLPGPPAPPAPPLPAPASVAVAPAAAPTVTPAPAPAAVVEPIVEEPQHVVEQHVAADLTAPIVERTAPAKAKSPARKVVRTQRAKKVEAAKVETPKAEAPKPEKPARAARDTKPKSQAADNENPL
jgi:hypothetical protein